MARIAAPLLVVLAALNIVDVLIHIAVDQVEPLRVASNVLVIVASVLMLVVRSARRSALTLAVAVGYLALNVVFIAIFSIGALGAILVGVTSLLLMLLAVAVKR